MADLPPGALAPFVHTFRVVGGVDGPRRFVDARVASAATFGPQTPVQIAASPHAIVPRVVCTARTRPRWMSKPVTSQSP